MSDSCIVPWLSIYISPDGKVAPCCAFYRDKYKTTQKKNFFEEELLSEVRTLFSSEAIHLGCRDCFRREHNGLTSRRTNILQQYKSAGIDFDGSKPRLQHLDISFGNVCNMKCRFCRPENSSAWIPDQKKLNILNSRSWSFSKEHTVCDNTDFIRTLLEQDLTQLKQIEIKGGEPFLYKEHAAFLSKLAEKCESKDVEILYCSNGTKFDFFVEEQWRKFKSVRLIFSIDGSRGAYQYIRGQQFNLDKNIIPNIRMYDQMDIKNLSISIYFTLCVYNVFELLSFEEWVMSLNLKKLFKIRIEPLTDPRALSISVLPREVRQQIAKQIPQTILYQDAISALNQEFEQREKLFEDFKKYTKELDQVRHTNVLDFIPEIKEFL